VLGSQIKLNRYWLRNLYCSFCTSHWTWLFHFAQELYEAVFSCTSEK